MTDRLAVTKLVRDMSAADQTQLIETLLDWHITSTNQMLDRIASSVRQHTVPDGRYLVTRSYVLNTIESERLGEH
jgi:hypothetical protein